MLKPTLMVQHTQFSYPVFIGQNQLPKLALWQKLISHQQIMVISDEQVAQHHLKKLLAGLVAKEIHTFILKAGENSKSIQNFEKIIDALVEQHFARDCLIIGLGGGMVTDLAGFSAASYMRGVAFIQVPTTLLAQVDAAIGGKTALNHKQAKNIIGCFYQPAAVVIDLNTLDTLNDREFCAGLAEVIKIAAILDGEFFKYLENHINELLGRDKKCLFYTIQRCCELKAHIVQLDEKEQGIRSLLNFGHTYGHALERQNNYSTYLHGEAVAIGMVIAAEISMKKLGFTSKDRNRLVNLLMAAKLPIRPNLPFAEADLQASLKLDKKTKNGKLRMILLESIGKGVIY